MELWIHLWLSCQPFSEQIYWNFNNQHHNRKLEIMVIFQNSPRE